MGLNETVQSVGEDAAKHRKFESQKLVSTQIPTMTKQELSEAIAVAYHVDSQKPELIAVKDLARYGRKYGFPVICEIAEQSQDEQILWAAKLLLNVLDTWPSINSPDGVDFELIAGSQLHTDAVKFVGNALATTQRFNQKQ